MLICGNCSITDDEDAQQAIDTAIALQGIATHFRVKVILGGTTPEKYKQNYDLQKGKIILEEINKIIPTGTEVHTPEHVKLFENLSYIWVGCRNSHNYTLLESLKDFKGDAMVKRGYGMTIDELIGIYDIMEQIHKKKIYVIERGIVTFDRVPESRWSPDLKGVIRLKHERPDIFERLIVDCSHSVFIKEYVPDVYKAFKAVGVQHFMFECSSDGKSKTDQGHMLSVQELKDIING